MVTYFQLSMLQDGAELEQFLRTQSREVWGHITGICFLSQQVSLQPEALITIWGNLLTRFYNFASYPKMIYTEFHHTVFFFVIIFLFLKQQFDK